MSEKLFVFQNFYLKKIYFLWIKKKIWYQKELYGRWAWTCKHLYFQSW